MSQSVADSTGYGPNRQMSLFGYLLAGILAIALLPLLPVIVVGWLLWRLLRSEDEEPPRRSWKRRGRAEPE
ncbi:hypothetical protein ACFQGT_05360 [Natrialbaceae archaeon GCM10025810]|uniref:DUF7535 family protein n=1 Tax=Halovalidus salilacus TaxID=3075124 RepID=UPI003612B287